MIPPAVEPKHPPIHIRAVNTAFEAPDSESGLTVENPEVVNAENAWKNEIEMLSSNE